MAAPAGAAGPVRVPVLQLRRRTGDRDLRCRLQRGHDQRAERLRLQQLSLQSGGTVQLTFTAPHGNLFCGNASGYEVRYSTTSPITDATWAHATLASAISTSGCRYNPKPAGAAGTRQTIKLTGCPTGRMYFDVQACNHGSAHGGNLAAISSSSSSTTFPAPVFPASLVTGGAALLAGRARRRRRLTIR